MATDSVQYPMARAATVAMAIRKFSSRKLLPRMFLAALTNTSYPVMTSPTKNTHLRMFPSISVSITCSNRSPRIRNAIPTISSQGNLCFSSSSSALSSMGHIWNSGSAAWATLTISRSMSAYPVMRASSTSTVILLLMKSTLTELISSIPETASSTSLAHPAQSMSMW